MFKNKGKFKFQAVPACREASEPLFEEQSVSLCFRVAMLLKTQFACHRIRGKLIIRKKKFIVLNCITCLFCQKNKKREPSPLVGEGGNR